MSFTVYLRNMGTPESQRHMLATGCRQLAQHDNALVCWLTEGPRYQQTVLAHLVRGKWCPVDDRGFLWDGIEVVCDVTPHGDYPMKEQEA